MLINLMLMLNLAPLFTLALPFTPPPEWSLSTTRPLVTIEIKFTFKFNFKFNFK